MADELSDDEKEILKRHRAAQAEARKAEEKIETWIRSGDNEATLPYHKARQWLSKTFGIDLDDEPVQDEPAADAKDDGKDTGGTVKRFTSGRRIS